jgi:hypothetical protein
MAQSGAVFVVLGPIPCTSKVRLDLRLCLSGELLRPSGASSLRGERERLENRQAIKIDTGLRRTVWASALHEIDRGVRDNDPRILRDLLLQLVGLDQSRPDDGRVFVKEAADRNSAPRVQALRKEGRAEVLDFKTSHAASSGTGTQLNTIVSEKNVMWTESSSRLFVPVKRSVRFR